MTSSNKQDTTKTMPAWKATANYKFWVFLRNLARKDNNEKDLNTIEGKMTEIENLYREGKLTNEPDPWTIQTNQRSEELRENIKNLIEKYGR